MTTADARALLRSAKTLVDARRQRPDHPHRRGVELAARGDYDGAVTAFAAAIHEEPDSPWTWLALADAQLALGQRSGAAGSYREVLERTPQEGVSLRESAAVGLTRSGSPDEAVSTLRALVEDLPERGATRVALARALIAAARAREDEAVKLLLQSDECDIDDPMAIAHLAPRSPGLYRILAASAARQRDALRARQLIELALVHDPADERAAEVFAETALLLDEGAPGSNQRDIERALELLSSNPDSHVSGLRARLADRLTDDPMLAATAWARLAEQRPDDPECFRQLGDRVVRAGAFEAAGAAYDRAVALGYRSF
jgi:tetratricopeptide (TPR) repeat protein